jgi:hypothetical protein
MEIFEESADAGVWLAGLHAGSTAAVLPDLLMISYRRNGPTSRVLRVAASDDSKALE